MRDRNPFEEASKSMNEKEIIYSNTELQRVNAIAEGIKQLQDFKHILGVTELTGTQGMLFSKAKQEAKIWDYLVSLEKGDNNPDVVLSYDGVLNDLGLMLLSKDRKSRKEILTGLGALAGKKRMGERLKDAIRPQGGNEE